VKKFFFLNSIFRGFYNLMLRQPHNNIITHNYFRLEDLLMGSELGNDLGSDYNKPIMLLTNIKK
jgi:hypothetical protein